MLFIFSQVKLQRKIIQSEQT